MDVCSHRHHYVTMVASEEELAKHNELAKTASKPNTANRVTIGRYHADTWIYRWMDRLMILVVVLL